MSQDLSLPEEWRLQTCFKENEKKQKERIERKNRKYMKCQVDLKAKWKAEAMGSWDLGLSGDGNMRPLPGLGAARNFAATTQLFSSDIQCRSLDVLHVVWPRIVLAHGRKSEKRYHVKICDMCWKNALASQQSDLRSERLAVLIAFFLPTCSVFPFTYYTNCFCLGFLRDSSLWHPHLADWCKLTYLESDMKLDQHCTDQQML